MTQPLLTWLHLSDIHFGHGNASYKWDQRLVLEALLDDLAEQCRHLHRPNLVFLTGDIAFSGKPEQYAQARIWLKKVGCAVGLGPEQIYVVPGNHDVDRSTDRDRDVARLLGALRSGQESFDAALEDQSDRKKLATRIAAYLEFAASLAPACRETPLRPPEERLFWQHREPRDRLYLRIIGLNTALLASDDQDQGRLALGREQLARTLTEPAIEPGELVIALSHHPLQAGWLADESVVAPWLRNHAHVHLSGHVHDAASVDARSGTGERVIRVAAGAAHGEAQPTGGSHRHGYNISSVILGEDSKLRLRVWPRLWSDNHTNFVVDVHNVPRGQEYAEHSLSLTASSPGEHHLSQSGLGINFSPINVGVERLEASRQEMMAEFKQACEGLISDSSSVEKKRTALFAMHQAVTKHLNILEATIAQGIATSAHQSHQWQAYLAETASNFLETFLSIYTWYADWARALDIPLDDLKPMRASLANTQRALADYDPDFANEIRNKFQALGLPTMGFDRPLPQRS